MKHFATGEVTPQAARHVVDNLWERGAQELDILGISRGEALNVMAHCLERGYPTLAWSVDGIPVVVTGLMPTGPGVMCSWFLATEEFTRYQRSITLAVWREMEQVAKARGLREIEVFSTCRHPEAARWFEALGFRLDVDRHPGEGGIRTYRFVRKFEGS